MALRFDDLRREFPAMLKLAAPLALAELGWMVMGVVDMLMAGPLGPAAIGATGLAGMLFYPIVISGAGLLLGMDTLVSQAHGAGDPMDCRRTLVDGCWLALALAAPLVLVSWSVIPVLAACGVGANVLAPTGSFLRAMLWGIPPLLLYFAFRRYLQAVEIVKPVTFALISANVVNFLGNYALIYGHWGLPRLGLAGSGYSTSLARLYMAGVMLAAVAWNERRSGWMLLRIPWRPHWARLRRLVALGGPAALQILVEGAVFGLVSAFAARLDEASLAAHGLAINVIGTTYMVPLGVSSAAAVRVGHAVGRRDQAGIASAGWAALTLSAVFMTAAGAVLWVAPQWIIGLYSQDASVLAIGARLLRIAAIFELFDGLQVTATGALRGLGDTRTPMLAHLAGYWTVGLPLAYILCFYMGLRAAGIWIGLCAAIVLIGIVLLTAWQRKMADLS